MKKFAKIITLVYVAAAFTSCSKDKDPIVVIPPSDGSTLTLDGLIGSESGASAGNSVYVDFSKDQQTAVNRISWDLGFYSGADFRVILNNSTSAAAKVTNATSLSAIGAADTVGLKLAIEQAAPDLTPQGIFDAVSGSLTTTAIPAISANAAENKVIILNRGTGGGIPARSWIKLKITRNASGGYTLQYATIKESSAFTTVEIPKDGNFNFKYVSLTSGALVNVEPEKANWDLVWGYSVYQTSYKGALVPYNFSDLVFLNVLNGVQAAEILTTTVTYDDYKESNIASTTFKTDRDVIGSNWRVSSQTASGVNTDRFYVIKDGAGNVYKLKFVSFAPADGGVRGKPVIEYKLVKKG